MPNNTDKTEEIIKERLAKIDEAINELKKFNEISLEKYKANKTIQYASIYALVIGIEAVCDIGNHILTYYFARKPDSYKDIILQLAEVDVISKEFAEYSQEMTDFRNLVIHVYLKIDEEKVYSYIGKAIEQFEKYAKYYIKFIESK